MRPEDILVPTPAGVCCKRGGFHIDPTRPVAKAFITHGHSDHARAGHGCVRATQKTLDIMRLRYGDNFAGTTQAAPSGETLTLDGVRMSFHPAGHVPHWRRCWSARNILRRLTRAATLRQVWRMILKTGHRFSDKIMCGGTECQMRSSQRSGLCLTTP